MKKKAVELLGVVYALNSGVAALPVASITAHSKTAPVDAMVSFSRVSSHDEVRYVDFGSFANHTRRVDLLLQAQPPNFDRAK